MRPAADKGKQADMCWYKILGYGHESYGVHPYGHSKDDDMVLKPIIPPHLGVRDEGERLILVARSKGIPMSQVRTPIKTSVKVAQ